MCRTDYRFRATPWRVTVECISLGKYRWITILEEVRKGIPFERTLSPPIRISPERHYTENPWGRHTFVRIMLLVVTVRVQRLPKMVREPAVDFTSNKFHGNLLESLKESNDPEGVPSLQQNKGLSIVAKT